MAEKPRSQKLFAFNYFHRLLRGFSAAKKGENTLQNQVVSGLIFVDIKGNFVRPADIIPVLTISQTLSSHEESPTLHLPHYTAIRS